MRVAPPLVALVLASVALASPPAPQHHIFGPGPPLRAPKVIRHLVLPHKFNKHPHYVPAASRHVLKRHHFPSSGAPFGKGCSDCSKQGAWKPIIPAVSVHKSVLLEQQPLLPHPVHIESHPAHFHIQIERFPGSEEATPTANVQFNSGPWGGSDAFGSAEAGGSSASGSAESSSFESDEGQFFKAGPPVQLQLNNHADEQPPLKGSKDYAVHEQVDEPPAPPRRTPKGGIQLLPNLIPSPPPPGSQPPAAPAFKSSFFRRRRQHPNVQIIPSRNVRVIHMKA